MRRVSDRKHTTSTRHSTSHILKFWFCWTGPSPHLALEAARTLAQSTGSLNRSFRRLQDEGVGGGAKGAAAVLMYVSIQSSFKVVCSVAHVAAWQ